MGIMRGRSDNAVIFSGGHDKDKVSYCEDCLKVKILSPLNHRIYLDDDGKITNPGPDADKWRQCWTCGVVVAVYEAKLEAELDTLNLEIIPSSLRAVKLKQKNHGSLTGQARHRERRN